MNRNYACKILFYVLIFLFVVLNRNNPLHAVEVHSGMGMGTQVHYSKNTFRFSPGAAIHFSLNLHPKFDCDFRLFVGALMGNSILLESGISYNFLFGKYIPGIGIHCNLDFGSVIFHTDSGQDIIYPTYPEVGLCITLKPAVFRFSRVDVSFIDISVGTDLLYPGRILLLSLELLHIEYRF